MATSTVNATTVKTIGANGQISIGKEYAGRHVLVEEQQPGVWLIKTATVIPDDERILHEPAYAVRLAAALEWSAANPTQTDNADEILERLAE